MSWQRILLSSLRFGWELEVEGGNGRGLDLETEMELAVAGLDSGLCVVTDFRY